MNPEDLGLGKLIRHAEPARDAIHIAVIPVVAGAKLSPGDRVLMLEGKAIPCLRRAGVGVVDPYLNDNVLPGERFWCFLEPGSIRSLRHVWTHPAFPNEAGSVESARQVEAERWLREHARLYHIDYEEMLEGAISGEGACFGDDDGPQFARTSEFWTYVSAATGRLFSADHIENTYFHCAC
jgi:hypothetical protein